GQAVSDVFPALVPRLLESCQSVLERNTGPPPAPNKLGDATNGCLPRLRVACVCVCVCVLMFQLHHVLCRTLYLSLHCSSVCVCVCVCVCVRVVVMCGVCV